MSHEERFRHYLHCYAAKDLDGISRMLADDVTLRDWNISVRGRAAVEAATRQNFADVRSIEIKVLALYRCPDAVAGELRIVVDDAVELHVIDVIEFDGADRIRSVRSYKGRAD